MDTSNLHALTAAELAENVRDAGQYTLDLVADLSDEQLMGPRLATINPLRWEIGHAAWFFEKWILRHGAGLDPIRADADALYDSIAIAHDIRWDLPLPSRAETLDYLAQVQQRVQDRLAADGGLTDDARYHVVYALFHQDMHTEAYTYTRQTLAYTAPTFTAATPQGDTGAGPLPGDVCVPGGTFLLGAARDGSFAFDNEKWAHPVELKPFAIARAPVTQAAFAAFVDAGGYRDRALWSDDGWQWRKTAGAEHPVYWRADADGAWRRRDFDRWVQLEPHRPVIHVNWHEAQTYCRWSGRRLPAEAEWEAAAGAEPTADGQGLTDRKRRYPWGDDPPTPDRVNMDWRSMGCADVAACPAGDSAVGCRQMIGNVWEWTENTFLPYPDFTPDPYKEYSATSFDTRKVLRGGAWPSRSRMLRNTWRTYYEPHRRDVWAGFRTCAAE